MKFRAFVLLASVLFISKGLFAQGYSVWFTSPSNNSWVSGNVSDSYRSTISLSFSYSGTKADSRNRWKFHIVKDIITGISQSSASDTWVYEGTSSCNLPGEVLVQNAYLIYMFEEDYATKEITPRANTPQHLYVYVNQTAYVENNFSAGYVSVNSSNYSSGSSFNLSTSSALNLTAIGNQTDSQGYTRIWNAGSTNQSFWSAGGSSISCTYYPSSSQNGLHIVAYLRKLCNITFGGPVYAGGTLYSSDPVQVVEGNSVSVTASSRVNNYINQNFQSWADNSSTQNPRSFTTSNNLSVGMNYTDVNPNNGYRNLYLSTTVGSPIVLHWNEHPSTNVTQYKIYRKVRPNGGSISSEQLIATISRGTTSFTDYDYVYSNTFYYQVFYDVRAYLQTNGSTSDVDFVSTYADQSLIANNNHTKQQAVSKEIPSEYSISNYPNPFNPTTTINYTLPADGMVTLKVYDILGKEVATLVNENKQAGYYSAAFDAGRLTSGMYIYTITANGYTQSKKMMLMK